MASAARLLAKLIANKGLATLPGGAATVTGFGITIGVFPQEDKTDSWIVCTDYDAKLEPRETKTGQLDQKPKVQIRVRASDYDVAHDKAAAILEMLTAGIHADLPVEVVVATQTWKIKNCSIVSGVGFMGQEEKNKRQHFSLNVQLTCKQVV